MWKALIATVRGSTHGSGWLARPLRSESAAISPDFAATVGQTVPGFRVAAAEVGRRLALHGRHRFAEYALIFEIADGVLRARTHAAFPGLRGRIYRALVIGSGAHRIVTRRLLRRVARATLGEAH